MWWALPAPGVAGGGPGRCCVPSGLGAAGAAVWGGLACAWGRAACGWPDNSRYVPLTLALREGLLDGATPLLMALTRLRVQRCGSTLVSIGCGRSAAVVFLPHSVLVPRPNSKRLKRCYRRRFGQKADAGHGDADDTASAQSLTSVPPGDQQQQPEDDHRNQRHHDVEQDSL